MSRPARKVLRGSRLESTVNYGEYITQNETKSVLKDMDWFEEIEYAPENTIVEVLDEDTEENLEVFGYDSDRFDSDSFSIWADL